jgi:hypothetical protein
VLARQKKACPSQHWYQPAQISKTGRKKNSPAGLYAILSVQAGGASVRQIAFLHQMAFARAAATPM